MVLWTGMERPPKLNKEAGISRVHGASPEQEQELLSQFSQETREPRLPLTELQKSPELKAFTERLIADVDDYIRSFGCTPVAISADNISFNDYSMMSDEYAEQIKRYQQRAGEHHPLSSVVSVHEDPITASRLRLASIIVHELFHLHSYKALLQKDDGGTTPHRFGFRVYDRNKSILFHYTDEALVSELTRRFFEQYFPSNPHLKDVLKKARSSSDPFLGDYKTSQEKDALQDSYDELRVGLNSLITALWEEHSDEFPTREDVFALFVRALFNGDMAPVSRLINSTYGAESFKALGQTDALNLKKQQS